MCAHVCLCACHVFMCRSQAENDKYLSLLLSGLFDATMFLTDLGTQSFDQFGRPVRPWGTSVSVPYSCSSPSNTGTDHLGRLLKPGFWGSELSSSHHKHLNHQGTTHHKAIFLTMGQSNSLCSFISITFLIKGQS